MTLEALASNELPNFLIYDTISATPHPSTTAHHHHVPDVFSSAFDASAIVGSSTADVVDGSCYNSALLGSFASPPAVSRHPPPPPAASSTPVGRKKRRRRPRSCKNKEEAESQRMTHIAVERNRRRQMNEHLAVLRALMPESYIQRGDQASIVGGAIDFVKELEQLLQSLEAQKRTLQQQQSRGNARSDMRVVNGLSPTADIDQKSGSEASSSAGADSSPPFAQFFSYPQYMWCHAPQDYTATEGNRQRGAAVADIEVTLIETHASLRILSAKRPGQLLKMVAGFQALQLTILHLNVTTLEPMVLYSFSAKVEEGCNLTTVDDIAAAVHHMLTLIEAEALCS